MNRKQLREVNPKDVQFLAAEIAKMTRTIHTGHHFLDNYCTRCDLWVYSDKIKSGQQCNLPNPIHIETNPDNKEAWAKSLGAALVLFRSLKPCVKQADAIVDVCMHHLQVPTGNMPYKQLVVLCEMHAYSEATPFQLYEICYRAMEGTV
jgi:hypothetical protein